MCLSSVLISGELFASAYDLLWGGASTSKSNYLFSPVKHYHQRATPEIISFSFFVAGLLDSTQSRPKIIKLLWPVCWIPHSHGQLIFCDRFVGFHTQSRPSLCGRFVGFHTQSWPSLCWPIKPVWPVCWIPLSHSQLSLCGRFVGFHSVIAS